MRYDRKFWSAVCVVLWCLVVLGIILSATDNFPKVKGQAVVSIPNAQEVYYERRTYHF